MVFQRLVPAQSHKIKNRHDLESELFGSSESNNGVLPNVRDNEGVAAEHGIYFDDTEYDYMQHIRDPGVSTGNGEIHLVEVTTTKEDGKGKAKMSLEDALRESSLQDERNGSGNSQARGSQLLDDDLLPSKNLKNTTYQDQQDVPDSLAGFQPDMDPRLREVLEALEDDAYVDDDEEIFGEIAVDGQQLSLDEFKESGVEEDGTEDAGWETDETERPSKGCSGENISPLRAPPDVDAEMRDRSDHGDGDWMKEFSKFKKAERSEKRDPIVSNNDLHSSITMGTSLAAGRRKKRKGAMSSSTGYSMTSSSLLRTEGQSLLDARFDKIEEEYAGDEIDMDDGTSSIMTGSLMASSQASLLATRSDFDSIMDDFLGGYSIGGKKGVKKGRYQSGMEQLDEVRKGLGPARVRAQKA